MAGLETRLLMLIDEDAPQLSCISPIAEHEGFDILTAKTYAAALETLGAEDGPQIDILMFDGEVAQDNARTFIQQVHDLQQDCTVLVIGNRNAPEIVFDAMRAGANDYLVKPIKPERLTTALRNSSLVALPRDELLPLSEKLVSILDFDAMVGSDAQFRIALAKAAAASRGNGHVLVEGESGTGKAMLLKAIQHSSARAKGPTELLECAVQQPDMLEALIFGRENGAVPNAPERQEGILARCDGGTVMIGSIDALPFALQERLDAALDTGIVRPSGAAHGFKIDVRILATSQQPLDELVEDGLFSPALYEKLSLTNIVMPPLRERTGDIPALTRFFLAAFGEVEGVKHHSIADSGLSLLEAYDWPGNVRQLQNVLFRACINEQREALTAHSFPHLSELLGDADRGESRARGLGVLLYKEDGNLRTLAEIEADVIRIAIGQYHGKMSEVARRLGIGRSTLYRKLQELGIDNPG